MLNAFGIEERYRLSSPSGMPNKQAKIDNKAWSSFIIDTSIVIVIL